MGLERIALPTSRLSGERPNCLDHSPVVDSAGGICTHGQLHIRQSLYY